MMIDKLVNFDRLNVSVSIDRNFISIHQTFTSFTFNHNYLSNSINDRVQSYFIFGISQQLSFVINISLKYLQQVSQSFIIIKQIFKHNIQIYQYQSNLQPKKQRQTEKVHFTIHDPVVISYLSSYFHTDNNSIVISAKISTTFYSFNIGYSFFLIIHLLVDQYFHFRFAFWIQFTQITIE